MRSGFSALLDDLAVTQRREEDAEEGRKFIKSFVDSGRRSTRAFAKLSEGVGALVKSMEATRLEQVLAERSAFQARLSEAIDHANRAAAAGLLTGEQGARLDHQIASLAQRAQELSQ